MPPKVTTASAKAASIPNRQKVVDPHLNGTSAGGSAGKSSKDAYSQEQEQYKREIDRLQSQIVSIYSSS
jgi:hypothetical protein